VISIGKNLSDAFPTQNDVKQGDALSSLLFNFALEYVVWDVQAVQEVLEIMKLLTSWSMLMIYCWTKTYIL